MNEEQLQKRLDELGLDVDELEELVNAIEPLAKLLIKYRKEHIAKLLFLALEIIEKRG